MVLLKSVCEGALLPRGYGIAWVDPLDNRAWCLPVPINSAASIVRRIWHATRRCVNPSVIDAARAQGYRAGRWRTLREVEPRAERIVAQYLRIMAARKDT